MSSISTYLGEWSTCLTAVFCAFAAVGATLATLFTDETTAEYCQAGHQASAVLLLGCLLHGGRSLLVAHLLLRRVVLALGRSAILALRGTVLTLRRSIVGLLGLLRVVVGHVDAINLGAIVTVAKDRFVEVRIGKNK